MQREGIELRLLRGGMENERAAVMLLVYAAE